MKIIISDLAKDCLKDIYDYHLYKASKRVANSIQRKIIAEIKSLPDFHKKFQLEEALEKIDMGHRRCVIGNYKIIYRIVDNKIIHITSIFDTRQDPKKIKG
jgi:toxin ParE1/3/4